LDGHERLLIPAKLLQQSLNKLTQKMSPIDATDPLKVLPVELAEMVLSYLSFKEMVNCVRVNKSWRDFLVGCLLRSRRLG
jgi:F-box/TPR repeat protein Pof3